MAIYELSAAPACYAFSVTSGTNFGGANLTVFGNGLCSRGLVLQNQSSGAVSVQLNQSNTAIFVLEGNSTLTIPSDMCVINAFDLANQSGYGDGGTTSKVLVIAGLS